MVPSDPTVAEGRSDPTAVAAPPAPARPVEAPPRPRAEASEADPALALASRLAAGARAISRAEPLLLRAQALLLAWLAENRRVDPLSFTSVSGYAGEHLGLEPRTVANRIALHRSLADRPEAERAFLAGRLSACQVLALRPVLRRSTTRGEEAEEAPVDHGAWVALAEGMPVREIRERVRSWMKERRVADPEAENEIEPEGRARSFACPRPFVTIWDETMEQGRRALGHEAPQWKVLDAVLAETGYAGRGEVRPRRRREAGRGSAQSARPGRPANHPAGGATGSARVRGAGEAGRTLAEVEKYLADLADLAAPTEPGNALEAHMRLVQIRDLLCPLRVYLGKLLRDLRVTGSLRRLGYPDEKTFLQEELLLCDRTARYRVGEADLFEDHPDLAKAYGSGEIGVAAAHMLARLAPGRQMKELIARAREVTSRQLRREYRLMSNLRECGERLGGRWAYCVPPMPGLEEALREALCRSGWTRKRMNRVFHRRGVAPKAREESEDPAENQALMDRLEWMVERLLLAVWDDPPDPVENLPVQDRKPFSSEPSAQGWTRISVWVTEEVEADFEAAVEDLEQRRGGDYPVWMAWMTLFLEATRVWGQVDPRGRPRWSRVLNRDGWRCRAPGCRRRQSLQAHHIVFRSRGGGDGIDNLIVLCASCHGRLVHEGRLTVQGRALEDLRWALGNSLPGGPLAVLKGERIVWRRDLSAEGRAA